MTTGDDVRIEVLGQIQVTDDDVVVSLSPQTRRLIGVLVTAAGEPVSADRIAEYVADGRAEGSSVRTAVSRARKVLGDRLSFGEGGYRLSLSDEELDAASFDALVERARSASDDVRVETLASALELWRGRAFGELADEDWAIPLATRLDLARATVTEDLAATLLAAGRPSEAVEILEAHIVEHAYRERPVSLLMQALGATGRRSDAVRTYQRFRTSLRDDTGLDPSSELRDLEAELLADDTGPASSVPRLPTGTVTFLFTDIEGSTERWAADEDAMAAALAAHDSTIRGAVESHGGLVFKHTGDGMCAAFVSAPEAVAAACEAAAVEVQAGVELPVRIGLHTGEAESRDGDYFGPTLNRAARIMDAGHGGQVLVSSATAGLARDHELVDLGEHQLKGLDTAERIFQVGLGEFPPLRTPRPALGNMPVELSTFVGRVDEVGSLVEELGEHRLVTLIGVGGTGKTRLSVEAARSVSESFPDGCWMVELAVVAVAEAVPYAFCAGLSMKAPPDGDATGHLLARLGHKRALLVVDNCEHVLAASADVVENIIESCPNVVVLVTSREPLMIRGERLVPVPSLLPEDAERLFVERARDEAPDLVIDADQARAVTELCERLDGLPLALELAASRVRAFTPVELVTNLEERFRMLVGGRRSRMERHQTMRGTLDWSYDLCSEVEQAVFDRLSVFPAGFDMPAACAVACGEGASEFDVIDVVPQLVDRSLVQRSTAPDGTTRYRMLETMRAYAREHLQHQGTADATRARHARYMAATIGPLTLHMIGPDEEQAVQRLDEYLADSLVALDWFIDHQEWENGLRVIPPSGFVSERDSGAMFGRLHGAARVGGAPTVLLDVLANCDNRWLLGETIEQQTGRGWRLIRAQMPIASDRLVVAPYRDFIDGGVAEADVDEYLASVERWLVAPPATRALAEWCFVRSLANSGHLDLVDEPLSRLVTLVAELHSVGMARMVDDLHGTVARIRHDWVSAARWYGKVVDAGDGQLRQWIDLSAAWHLLTARSLCAVELDITGHELRDPWLCYREQRLDVLRWRGSVATALALHRLGHTDLADRFATWVARSDHEQITTSDQFIGVLQIAGLPTTHIGETDDLDTLIDELLVVADEIDQRTK